MRGTKPASIIAGSSTVDDVPKAPAWLAKSARAEWKRLAPILISERKTLTVADLAGFANYCDAIGEATDAAKIVAKEGLTVVSASGLPKKHPAVAIKSDAVNRARLLAAELGCTPVSRSRPAIRDTDAKDDLAFLD